jgi:hypothetical protein
MEKIFLVQTDNGESYEGYQSSIVKIFSSYRLASEWLMQEKYKPYPDEDERKKDIFFYWEAEEGKGSFGTQSSFANIFEMKIDK